MKTCAALLQATLANYAGHAAHRGSVIMEPSDILAHLSSIVTLGSNFTELIVANKPHARTRSYLPYDTDGDFPFDAVFGSLSSDRRIRILAYFEGTRWGVMVLNWQEEPMAFTGKTTMGHACQVYGLSATIYTDAAKDHLEMSEWFDKIANLQPLPTVE